MKKIPLLALPSIKPGAELTETLLSRPGVRLERIVSRQASSPPDFWYDQDWDEWVAVLAGCGTLAFAGQPELVLLQAGEALFIPAHCRHRLDSTDPVRDTVWLALHVPAP